MEKYCVSLELAEQMKKLGFPQDTEFYWITFDNTSCVDTKTGGYKTERFTTLINKEEVQDYTEERPYLKNFELVSAPNVGELGEWLPNFKSGKNASTINDNDKWVCKKLSLEKFAFTEANARAKMLIYLVENKLLDVTDLV